jgi:hypothetical protein
LGLKLFSLLRTLPKNLLGSQSLLIWMVGRQTLPWGLLPVCPSSASNRKQKDHGEVGQPLKDIVRLELSFTGPLHAQMIGNDDRVMVFTRVEREAIIQSSRFQFIKQFGKRDGVVVKRSKLGKC